MSAIKHYDGSKWVVDGSSDAKNINLKNPLLLDTDTTQIDVERGFLKINNKISKLEHNLAWLYLNGAKGGSGGGSGSGSSYTIKIKDDQTDFYATSNSITIPVMISSGSIKKVFSVSVEDTSGKTYIDSESHTSLSYFNLTINNITSDVSLVISAHDSSDNYAEECIITIHYGSISLVNSSQNLSTQYILGGASNITGTFTVLNKTGSTAELRVYNSESDNPITNGDTPVAVWSVSSGVKESIYSIPFGNYIDDFSLGTKYNFKVVLYSETLGVTTQFESCPITIVSGTSLALITSGIADNLAYASQYTTAKGQYLTFYLTASYQPSTPAAFNYKYIVSNLSDEVLYEYNNDAEDFPKNTAKTITCPTSDFPEEVLKLTITVFAGSQTATKTVYFTITEASSGMLNNFKGNMIFHFGSFNFASSSSATNIKYTVPKEGDWGINNGVYPIGSDNDRLSILTLNNSTSSNGFILNSDGTKYIYLTGNTYATIDKFKTLFPDTSTLDNSLFSTGFYLQCTYDYNSDEPQDQTILSLGTYQDGTLYNGFEINSDYIKVAFGSVSGLTLETPIRGENYYEEGDKTTSTVTIGLKVWKAITTTKTNSFNSYYFSIYVDGVMTSSTIIPESDIKGKWIFADNLYLGCRSDLTNQANCRIYDITLYAQDVPDILPVWNWMSSIEQANLENNTIDSTLDTVLRKKNLFSLSDNSCLLCDSNGSYQDASTMYTFINTYYSTYDLDYPIVYLEETSADASDMYQYVKATWEAGATDATGTKITDKKWNVKVSIKTKYGDKVIESSESDSDIGSYSPNVSIQGTSSLSYNSKNLELRMGYVNSSTKKLLKINGWLPEYEFTLKADVVDSAHVNNVAIGNFVNDHDSLYNLKDVYPAYTTESSDIKSKIKKTSEGFPCLVFVKYATNGQGKGTTEFMGVYNFNLGRYAYHNLGLQTLKSYTPELTGTGITEYTPQIITEYEYDTSVPDAYSLEVEDNFGDDEMLFRQAHLSITQEQLSNRSPSYSDNTAYLAITSSLFTLLAQAFNGTTALRRRNDDGSYSNVTDSSGEVLYWTGDQNILTYENLNKYISLQNLYAYYVIAVIFGLVDSMCKNLVFRSWNGTLWTPSFYDMDSAFEMDNGGNNSIKYDAHPNRYYNVNGTLTEAETSTQKGMIWCPSSTSTYDDWTFTFAGTHNNRLWEILNSMDNNGNDATRKITIGDLYWDLREGDLKDSDEFIDKYFAGYINKTGAIMYNYDYKQKYLDYSRVWVEGTGFVSNISSKQTSFLYGTRISSVRKWLKKRIQFLDSVYLSYMPSKPNITSGIVSDWNSRQVAKSTISPVIISGTQRCKLQYQVSSGTTHSFWIDETPKTYLVETQTQANSWYLIGNEFIKTWDNFNTLGWSTFENPLDFRYLLTLNVSNLTNVNGLSNITPIYNSTSDNGLENVKIINMSGFTCGDDTIPSIDFSGCENLEELYLSGSNINSFSLPTGGALKILDLSNSNISSIPTDSQGISVLNGQSGLTTLNLSGTKIKNLELSDLPSLTTLNLPKSLVSLKITNCNLETISCTWTNFSKLSTLTTIDIEDCNNLKQINLLGQNNLTNLTILRCPNIESFNISKIKTPNNCYISFTGNEESGINLTGLTKLKELDISSTSIFSNIDLSDSPNLSNLYCASSTIKSIKCPYNKENPIELLSLAFLDCTQLTDLKGYFDLLGSLIFENCFNLEFDDNHDEFDFIISTNSIYRMFYNCTKLNGNWYKDIIHNIPITCTNAEESFCNSGINGELSKYALCCIVDGVQTKMGLTNCKGMFKGTSLNGPITEHLWDYLGDVTEVESMFESTELLYIDNDFFKGRDNLTNIDYMFSNCAALTAVIDADDDITELPLHSKDFFIDITPLNHSARTSTESSTVKNPSYVYPYGVFNGCNINMTVDVDDNGYPLLFHTKKDHYTTETQGNSAMLLDNLFYSGINLIYTPGNLETPELSSSTLFAPGERNIDGETYYVPNIQQITSPFESTSITINLSYLKGSYFLNSSLKILNTPFNGIKFIGSLSDDLLQNKTGNVLTSISNLFGGADMEFGTNVYTFTTDFFTDCTELTNISGIFQGFELYMLLCSNMFLNCSKLTNVSNAFANSRIIGQLPDKLFYGTKIKTMSNIFSGCYNLGYDAPCLYFLSDEESQEYHSYSEHLISITQEEYEKNPNPNPLKAGSTSERVSIVSDYHVPTDLFYYCDENPIIEGVLGDLFYKKRLIINDNGEYVQLTLDDYWMGPTDLRITGEFFGNESNTDLPILKSTELIGVFKNTRFKEYSSFNPSSSTNIIYGSMYPNDTDNLLFKYVPNLTTLESMFSGTEIYKGCKIEPTIFMYDSENYLKLKSVSKIWLNCVFNTSLSVSLSSVPDGTVDLIPTKTMFDNMNDTLRNASYAFAGNLINGTGIYFCSEDLLAFKDITTTYDNPLNIDYMFSNCPFSGQAVPRFSSGEGSYFYTGNPGTYLSGIDKNNITNSSTIMSSGCYYPSAWDETNENE